MKKIWIVLNIVLLIVLIGLVTYGIFVLMPKMESAALSRGQKHVIVMKNLDDIPDTMLDADGFKPVNIYGILDSQIKAPVDKEEAEQKKVEKKVEQQEQIILAESKYKIKIAILVTGIVNNSAVLQKLESLPGEVNLGYSPYCSDMSEHLSKIMTKGHEVFVQIPFEPESYPIDDPGYLGILKSQHNKSNLDRLNNILNKYTMIKGVYSDIGEKFTSYKDEFKPILEELQARKMIFLYGNNQKNLNDVIKDYDIVTVFNSFAIDQEVRPDAIRARLLELENIAITQGAVLAYAKPYPVTLSILAEWVKSLDNKGISLAPISQIIK